MKRLSIIIPVYNEEGNISKLYKQLVEVRNTLTDFQFEFILVNDGSSDKSYRLIREICRADSSVKAIDFSRNFGKEVATTAGINNCQGDAAIIIDSDLQHPPELIPEFIRKWQAGAEVVVGVRELNRGEGWIKKYGSCLYYRIMKWISETEVQPRETDFRLLDRAVIDEFNRFTEKNRITRGLIDWLGFNRDYIYFKANERNAGQASYRFASLIKLALASFVTHSLFPLKIAGYAGSIITLLSGIWGASILVEQYILKDPLGWHYSGPAQLAVVLLFLVGIVLSCLGLIALYIGNIHSQVMNRPLFVVKKKHNFE